MDTFIVVTYDGENLRQIGPVFNAYGLAAYEMKKAVAAYNGYDEPTDLPNHTACDFQGEWKQDGRVWKIFGNVRK